MNRSAVSIATHANRVATFVAACASVVRGTGKPQRRFAAGLRRPGRGACAERQHRDANSDGNPAWRRFHRPAPVHQAATRSEEHTSELQSLMRISSADFCLKKKTTKNRQ